MIIKLNYGKTNLDKCDYCTPKVRQITTVVFIVPIKNLLIIVTAIIKNELTFKFLHI